MKNNFRYIIGIDPGVLTGFAIWDKQDKRLLIVRSMQLHEALEEVKRVEMNNPGLVLVRIEDARKRKWFGSADKRQERSGAGIREGVGSVKRDCGVWEEFLSDWKIPFELVAPKNNATKLNAESFKKITGWEKQTNQHGRDSAMLCFGM